MGDFPWQRLSSYLAWRYVNPAITAQLRLLKLVIGWPWYIRRRRTLSAGSVALGWAAPPCPKEPRCGWSRMRAMSRRSSFARSMVAYAAGS